MREVQSFKHMAALLEYPAYQTRRRISEVQIQLFKRPNIMSIPCWRFSYLNTWRLGGYTGLSYVLDTSQAIKRPNTAIQTSKYHVHPMLKFQSFKHMAAILEYPGY